MDHRAIHRTESSVEPLDDERTSTMATLVGMRAAALMTGLGVVTAWGLSSPVSAATSHTFSLGTSHVAKVGTVLTTPSGLTLYRFTADTTGHATCTGGCAKVWPPLLVPTGDHLKGAKGVRGLGSIKVGRGRRQATLHGVALYRFSGDSKKGQDKGQGVEGTWFAVLANGSTADVTTPTSAPAVPLTPTSATTTTAPKPASTPKAVTPSTSKTTPTTSTKSTSPATTPPVPVPVTSPPTTLPATPTRNRPPLRPPPRPVRLRVVTATRSQAA
jgi:predicted lipoprotein with Yx(FWY)xxD motif